MSQSYLDSMPSFSGDISTSAAKSANFHDTDKIDLHELKTGNAMFERSHNTENVVSEQAEENLKYQMCPHRNIKPTKQKQKIQMTCIHRKSRYWKKLLTSQDQPKVN